MTNAEYLASHKEFIPVYGLYPNYGAPEHQAVRNVCDLRARLEAISFEKGNLAAMTEALNQLPRNPAEEFLEEIAAWMERAPVAFAREECGEVLGHNKHIVTIMRYVAADLLDEGRQFNALSRAYCRLYHTFHDTIFMHSTISCAMFTTHPVVVMGSGTDCELTF